MGKSSNKERVMELLCEKNRLGERSLTAEKVAEELGIQRNTASGILNELAREGIVQKEKTRPVVFSYVEKEVEDVSDDPFASFIGSDRSLKEVVEKCRLSAVYPNRGMPILLFGPSGVGKSLLAEYIYQYAKYIHTIPEDAPFIVLNCADYANNKELLSSVLFGYKKGAFTGAVKSTQGLIEQANHGYLFLDEVHRLPPEGQEKLFRYIDKGIVSRMGDNGHDFQLNVRLIFATTEGKEAMLDTFLRRIPVSVDLPPFDERSLEEKYQLIIRLIHQEAKVMRCRFRVSSNAFNHLLSFQGKGNIGTLKNIIKLSCAKAYSENHGKEDVVSVKIQHLSKEEKYMLGSMKIPYVTEDVEISPEEEYQRLGTADYQEIRCSDYQIKETIQLYLEKKISGIQFQKNIYTEINEFIDDVIYQKMDPFVQNMYKGSVHNIMLYLQDNYGLKYNGIMEMVLVKVLHAMNSQNKSVDESEYELLAKRLQMIMYRYYKMGLIFFEMIHQSMDYETSPWFIRLFTMLYFYSVSKEEGEYTNAIIVSHGAATASSIASMVNRVFETYIFEAFDMKYDTPKKEVVHKIKRYLKNTNTSKGVLIFVDMGSLLSIADDLREEVEGNLGIVNNITTEMALEAGERILKHDNMKEIMDDIVAHHVTKKIFVPSRQKEKTIVVCCMTGLGTAIKIKGILQECLEGINVQVIEESYHDLMEYGNQCEVFKKYNVQFIISTSKLEIDDHIVLQLNELMDERTERVIYETIGKYYEKEQVQRFIENIVRSFTIRNLIGQLTILNPDKIMDDVEEAITKLELLEGRKYSIDQKKMMYIHICVMVERLILEKGQFSEEDVTQNIKCQKEFIKNLKESFSVIEKKYNVSINNYEIKMIYDLTRNI